MTIDALTAGLHSPMIVWDAKKRHIVENMSETECFTIAKRCTCNLRDRSPEIRRYMDGLVQNRNKFAKLLFTQELVKFSLLSEDEVSQYERMARIAQAQKKYQTEIITFFQNEAGYRVSCLAYIAGDELLQQIVPLLENLEILSAQQALFDEAVLLDEMLGVLIKRASKYPDYNAVEQKAVYESVLINHTDTIRASLEQCSPLPGIDKLISEQLDEDYAQLPQLDDRTHSALVSFALIRDCFINLNQGIVESLADITAPIINDCADFRLQII